MLPVLVQLLGICTTKNRDKDKINVVHDAEMMLRNRTSLRMFLLSLGTMNGIGDDVNDEDLSTMMERIHGHLLKKHKRKINLPPMFLGVSGEDTSQAATAAIADGGSELLGVAGQAATATMADGGSESQGNGGGVTSHDGLQMDGTTSATADGGSGQQGEGEEVASQDGPEKNVTPAALADGGSEQRGVGGGDSSPNRRETVDTGSFDAPSTPTNNTRHHHGTRSQPSHGARWGKVTTNWNYEYDKVGQIEIVKDGHFRIPSTQTKSPFVVIKRGENVDYSTDPRVAATKRCEGIVLAIDESNTYVKLYSLQKTTCEHMVLPQTIEPKIAGEGEKCDMLGRPLPLSIKQTYDLIESQIGKKVTWEQVSSEYGVIHQTNSPKGSPKRQQNRVSNKGKSFHCGIFN